MAPRYLDATQLASSPVSVVLDYFGWIAGGVQQPGIEAILSLVKSGRAYVKLAEPYRLSKAPDYQNLVPVVQALLGSQPGSAAMGLRLAAR
jgi:predicted TIM-barrel fold metal-dependent hydrolase